MIDHRKRFVFIHIPKSGGTSIQTALRRRGYGIALQGAPNFDSLYFKHVTAADARRMMGEVWDDYVHFTVVRNPWDWVVSNYAYNRGVSLPYIRGTDYRPIGKVEGVAADWEFPRWLPWWIETFAPSQSQLLCDADGGLLVEHVIRFEELAAGFRDVARRVGLRRVRLPHVNVTADKRPYRSYYDAQTWELVARHFRTDIELLGYADVTRER